MRQGELTISRIELKNKQMALCFFDSSLYGQLPFGETITPMERVLVDSDHKQIVYIVESEDQWHYIRFPETVWARLDEVIAQSGDLFLIISLTDKGEPARSIPLKKMAEECRELVANIRHNANYGPELPELVEVKFKQTIAQLTR